MESNTYENEVLLNLLLFVVNLIELYQGYVGNFICDLESKNERKVVKTIM